MTRTPSPSSDRYKHQASAGNVLITRNVIVPVTDGLSVGCHLLRARPSPASIITPGLRRQRAAVQRQRGAAHPRTPAPP